MVPAVEDALIIRILCRSGWEARGGGGFREGTGMVLVGQEGRLTKGDNPHPGIDYGNEGRLSGETARWA